jgi:acyl dehydratase
VSEPVLHYEVPARNTATASENKIHDDTVARQYGFGGGLVPGVAVIAYMTRAPLERWGESWLEHGWMKTRLLSPVYDGETVTVEMDGSDALRLLNPAGETGATGTAGVHDQSQSPPDANEVPSAPLPDSRPPASAQALTSGTVLGTIEAGFRADRAEEYLSSIGDDSDVYRKLGVAHPGWLLQWANSALVANVRLGPWIHVESDLTTFRLVTDGQTVATRAKVTDAFDRKGHKFVTLDVLMLADGKPAMRVRHVAIWQLRAANTR